MMADLIPFVSKYGIGAVVLIVLLYILLKAEIIIHYPGSGKRNRRV